MAFEDTWFKRCSSCNLLVISMYSCFCSFFQFSWRVWFLKMSSLREIQNSTTFKRNEIVKFKKIISNFATVMFLLWHNKTSDNRIDAKYCQMAFRSVPTNPYLEYSVKQNWCKFKVVPLHSTSVVIFKFDSTGV